MLISLSVPVDDNTALPVALVELIPAGGAANVTVTSAADVNVFGVLVIVTPETLPVGVETAFLATDLSATLTNFKLLPYDKKFAAVKK
jgi:hypothetical protein